jgi:hypothetical protein
MSRLQGSGPISISDVNVELRRAWNSPLSFADPQVRVLAQNPAGQISMSELLGKQLYADYGATYNYVCSGTTRLRQFWDGNGGLLSEVTEYNSVACGYVPAYIPPPVNNNPPYGTVLAQYCQGNALATQYADGAGGIITNYDNNHPSCQVAGE